MRTERHVRHPAEDRKSAEHRWSRSGAAREGTGRASTAGDSSDATRKKLTEREALKLLFRQFVELREYASFYAGARIDSAKVSARNAIVRLLLTALGLVGVAGLIVLASGFVLSGIAQGLGALVGDRAWLGTLLTGLAALAGVGVGVQCVLIAHRQNARRRTVEKYVARQAQQRTRFGRDAHGHTPASVAGSE